MDDGRRRRNELAVLARHILITTDVIDVDRHRIPGKFTRRVPTKDAVVLEKLDQILVSGRSRVDQVVPGCARQKRLVRTIGWRGSRWAAVCRTV